jgi:hypothetical protein
MVPKALHLLLSGTLGELPCPCIQTAAWEQLWRQLPGAWAGLLRHARKRLMSCPDAGQRVMQECQPLAHNESQEEASEVEGFLCGSCDAVFATAEVANTHRGRVHRIGTMVSIKEFVTSSCCPVCGKDFSSRLRASPSPLQRRLSQHVQGSLARRRHRSGGRRGVCGCVCS